MLGMVRRFRARAKGRAAAGSRSAADRREAVGGVLLDHGGQVFGDHAVGLAEFDHPAVVEPQGAVADGFHVADRMGNEQNRDAARAQFMHLAHAALAEIDIAHRQSFVHQQDLRVHVDGDGKGQAHHHAAGVRLHRLVDKIADLREVRDVASPRPGTPRPATAGRTPPSSSGRAGGREPTRPR